MEAVAVVETVAAPEAEPLPIAAACIVSRTRCTRCRARFAPDELQPPRPPIRCRTRFGRPPPWSPLPRPERPPLLPRFFRHRREPYNWPSRSFPRLRRHPPPPRPRPRQSPSRRSPSSQPPSSGPHLRPLPCPRPRRPLWPVCSTPRYFNGSSWAERRHSSHPGSDLDYCRQITGEPRPILRRLRNHLRCGGITVMTRVLGRPVRFRSSAAGLRASQSLAGPRDRRQYRHLHPGRSVDSAPAAYRNPSSSGGWQAALRQQRTTPPPTRCIRMCATAAPCSAG